MNIFEASREPVAPPAPTIVWISSIKRIISSFFSSSFITAFILSSNCPLYFVPATKLARSRVTTRLWKRIRDTFFWIMRRASPSAIADLPTPGSPIRSGLFFFLRLKICDTRSISFSRPTTGSNFPSSAISVKSLPKLSKTGVLDFLFDLLAGLLKLLSLRLSSCPESSLYDSFLGKFSKNSSSFGVIFKYCSLATS
ncbi:hypothetical protein D3C86_530920 [compost metagenome]